MIGIYKITSPEGKIYIGQSVNVLKRKSYYFNISNTKKQFKIRESIEKYGFEQHTFEIIKECSIDDLNHFERYYQDFYDSIENGLNCRYTSSKNKSGKLSKDTILRISENRKGIKSNFSNPIERGLKISKSLTGKKLSLEHRKSISLAHKGMKRSKEASEKSAKTRTGMKQSLNFCKKMKLIQTGQSNSNAKITLNLETGIFYFTAKDAAESFGMSYNRFNHYMNGRTKTKLPFAYV